MTVDVAHIPDKNFLFGVASTMLGLYCDFLPRSSSHHFEMAVTALNQRRSSLSLFKDSRRHQFLKRAFCNMAVIVSDHRHQLSLWRHHHRAVQLLLLLLPPLSHHHIVWLLLLLSWLHNLRKTMIFFLQVVEGSSSSCLHLPASPKILIVDHSCQIVSKLFCPAQGTSLIRLRKLLPGVTSYFGLTPARRVVCSLPSSSLT